MNLSAASIYTSFQGLGELKARAAGDSGAALEAAARQFEALMLQQMLRAMRQAGPGEGLLDNDQSLFYRELYDQQLALHLAEGGGLGLTRMIVRQLGGLAPSQAEGSAAGRGIGAYPRRPPVLSVVPRPRAAEDGAPPEREIALATPHTTAPAAGEPVTDPAGWSKGEFVERLLPWAREAAALLGLQPEALLAQAALETGWGRRMVRFSDGAPAHNLFGIKADRRWQGNKVAVNTLEYEQGVAVRHRAYFRAYDSFRDSFSDYVRFLRQSPRYQGALALAEDPAAYFGELQRAGYATDPAYARKITRILEDEVLRGEAVDNSTARPL